jgi:hypothetical protein
MTARPHRWNRGRSIGALTGLIAFVLGALVVVLVAAVAPSERAIARTVDHVELPSGEGLACSKEDLCVSAEGESPDQQIEITFEGQPIRKLKTDACSIESAPYAVSLKAGKRGEAFVYVGHVPPETPPVQVEGVNLAQLRVDLGQWEMQFFFAEAPDDRELQIRDQFERYVSPLEGAIPACARFVSGAGNS